MLSNNSAMGGVQGYGGGISVSGATLTVERSTISNNSASGISSSGSGGGVIIWSGTLTVQNDSKIVRNFASDKGGGIFYLGGTGTISADSTVASNIPDDIYP